MKLSILLLVFLAGCSQSDGRYQMVAAQGGIPSEIKVWVLDTVSGKVSLCYETAATINCLPPSNRFPDQP